MHVGEYVINLLKCSMCLKALLDWEMRDIFSTCLIGMGYKSFAALSHKVALPCPHLGQALPLMEKAVHSNSDTSVPCTGKAGSSTGGCPAPRRYTEVGEGARNGRKERARLCAAELCSYGEIPLRQVPHLWSCSWLRGGAVSGSSHVLLHFPKHSSRGN